MLNTSTFVFVRKTLLLLNLLLFLAMFLLKQQNFSTQKNLTLAGKQIIALLQENEALDIELAYLTSPPRLRHILSSLQQNGYSPNLSILGLGDLKTLEDLTSFYNWRQLSLQKPPATTW